MPREFSRARRVSEVIRRELANIISSRLGDPRVGLVTITAVEVSKDLKRARVFVTCLGTERESADALKALRKATGFLSHELSPRLTTKTTPALTFVYDHSVARGIALSNLIDQANKPHWPKP